MTFEVDTGRTRLLKRDASFVVRCVEKGYPLPNKVPYGTYPQTNGYRYIVWGCLGCQIPY